MASTFAVTRNHLIFGLCLPFAVLLGYLLADVTDPVSRLAIVGTIAMLSFPLMMKWYHPVLIFSWNFTAQATFLPGAPLLWAFFAVIGLFFAFLNRSLNSENRFAHVPSLSLPIFFFGGVVLLTALMTGGIGLQVLGSGTGGGRNYFYIIAAIIGFFALSSRTISPNKAYLFIALFFLPGISATFNQIAGWIGNSANFVYYMFPGGVSPDAFSQSQIIDFSETRLTGMTTASFAFFSWMLARYGAQGVFDLAKPWRLILFLLGISLGFLGGFRSHFILMAITFGMLCFVERLWRTRVMFVVMVLATLLGVFVLAFADKLPPTVQRSLSFLPIGIDPMIKVTAESSTQWRIEIWKTVVNEVPTYFFKGKGYTVSADDLYMAQYAQVYGYASNSELASVAGDYHNGPLSLLIPFGIYGLIGFMWIIAAGSIFLFKAYRNSPAGLRNINAFLFACFTARAFFFFAFFGAVSFELYVFTGILGLSVALNTKRPAEPDPAGDLALQT